MGRGWRSREGRSSDGGEGRPLYVLRDGQPQEMRVTTGDTDGEFIEILSGLSEGDEVIVSASQR